MSHSFDVKMHQLKGWLRPQLLNLGLLSLLKPLKRLTRPCRKPLRGAWHAVSWTISLLASGVRYAAKRGDRICDRGLMLCLHRLNTQQHRRNARSILGPECRLGGKPITKRLRVLHGPVNIGNQPWTLSRFERRQGLQSELVVSYRSWLNYPTDRCLGQSNERTCKAVMRRFAQGLSGPFRYDVVHYYFGNSFLSWEDGTTPLLGRFLDLKLNRILGSKVFMTLQGCDVRQSDRSSARNPITMCRRGHCSFAPECRASRDDDRRRFISEILPFCHRIFVLNPELAQDVPGSIFLPYTACDITQIEPVWPRSEGKITILHAPTDETIKGTNYLLDAVHRLQKRWPIELLLVRKVPHAEAVKMYRRADLVIDQLLAGWYGAFAVESMAMGKPVGCYIREEDLHHIPAAMRDELPLLRLNPHRLEEDLENLLARRNEWVEWGKRSREFAWRWHHPARIASAMIRAYREPDSAFNLTEAPIPRLT